MLEETVFAHSNVEKVAITADVVSVNLSGTNLEETAKLVQMVEGYDIVSHVEVNTATFQEDYATRMLITLVEAGGD